MKKSEAFQVILDSLIESTGLDHTRGQTADNLLNYLEEAGLLNLRYFTPCENGLYDLHYGWEPENE